MFDKSNFDDMDFLELNRELKNHDPDYESEIVDYIRNLLETKYAEELSEQSDAYGAHSYDDGFDWTFEE